MNVSALYIYPVKSLRGISLRQADLTAQGIEHDRRFMLREIKEDGTRRNMACYHDPLMVRFLPEFDGDGTIKIRFHHVGAEQGKTTELSVPLMPDTAQLKKTKISMHGSETMGYDMGPTYNSWFSKCFGLDVELLYVGQNRRKVLGNLSPNVGQKAQSNGDGDNSWMQNITKNLPSIPLIGSGSDLVNGDHEQGLGLSDVAAVLVVSETSLGHVNRALPEGMVGDITKFRPNIVISGAEGEFSEDYWRELDISGHKVLLTQNCNRCVSLNLNYETGDFGSGPAGKVLANLTKDRRVDPGAKYSPIFGRYGFIGKDAHGKTISVGDKVTVTAQNKERTEFHWPFKVPS